MLASSTCPQDEGQAAGSPFPEGRVGRAAVEEPFGSWGKRGYPVPVADSSKVLSLAVAEQA